MASKLAANHPAGVGSRRRARVRGRQWRVVPSEETIRRSSNNADTQNKISNPSGEPWAALLEVFATSDEERRPAMAFRNIMSDAYSIEGQHVAAHWLENGESDGHAVSDGDRFWVKDVEENTRLGVALYALSTEEETEARKMPDLSL